MRLPFAPEAIPIALPIALAGTLLAPLAIPFSALWLWPATILLVLSFAIVLFFRDPERVIPSEKGIAVSPADGRVVRADRIEPDDDTPEGATKVLSIFLSITDVHINRAPTSGTIGKVEYRPGRFLAAFRERASRENERNEVRLDTETGPVTFRQISGAIARRIVFRLKEGDDVKRGDRIGLIRFGSRTDLFLGDDWEWTVKVGEKVRGGQTIVARRKERL